MYAFNKGIPPEILIIYSKDQNFEMNSWTALMLYHVKTEQKLSGW